MVNNSIYICLFFIIIALFPINIYSQTIEWDNTIGGLENEWLFSIELASDGNYILGGYSYSNISGDKNENSRGENDYWITKINDDSGDLLWQKTIGGSFRDHATSTKETTDGGYIVGGYSSSNISGDKTENSRGDDDYWIVKLDSNRNIVWDKTYGGNGVDRLWAIVETNDGGFLMGGESSSDISGDKNENSRGLNDMWVIKINSNGNIEWQKTYGGNDRDILKSIVSSNDGGYILTGFSSSDISGDKTENSRGLNDYWILKIDALGNIEWQRTIGGSNGDNAEFIQPTSDGNFIIGGDSASNISGEKTENSICNSTDVWIIKLDPNGKIIWDKTLGGDSTEWIGNIRETNDDGFIIGVMSYSDISGYKTENTNGDRDYWIVKLDEYGNFEYDKTIGGSNIDQLTSIVQAHDGNYVFGGWSSSNISGDKTENTNGLLDYWIVKLNLNTTDYSSQIYSTITICEGSDIELSAPPGTSYQWSGPNGFSSTEQNPVIVDASAFNTGVYNLSFYDNVSSCVEIRVINVILSSSISINPIDDIYACDDNNDGISEYFDTSTIRNAALGNQTGMIITYYDNSGNPLPNPLPNPYTNKVPYEETIIVRIALENNPDCYNETTFKLITDTSLCEKATNEFPHFFTPNQDGINDYWPQKKIFVKSVVIYDRYGKLLKTLPENSIGWDGTYNGKMLPESDYWFKATLVNGRVFKGHFTLKR